MSTKPNPFDPSEMYATFLAAWLDASKSAQENMIRLLETFGTPTSSPIQTVKVDMPYLSLMPTMTEAQMRDLFQGMADQNLRRWEHAANLLSTTPDWVNWSYKTPGIVMTELFDRMRRGTSGGIEAANDTAPAAAPAAHTPDLFDAPKGEPDDLTSIKGVGPKLSACLNDLGVYHFSQIAGWSAKDGVWIDEQLGFSGRVAREKWIPQARKLAKASAA